MSEEIVEFKVLLSVIDEEALRKAASDIHGSPVDSLAEAICEGVVNAKTAPLNSGFEILSKTSSMSNENQVLHVRCRVFCTEKVIAEAKERYEACWGPDEWEPVSLADALYEILVASNDNPSPDELGFGILEGLYPG